ncbi:MAG TPA: hypothetical protein VE967_16760 [Gemmatimonadaceae bacterium]|nr:hypothetical protein [Gemmatimonadaceae bacterium]
MKFERIASLGALGVCGGVLVTYLFLAWLGNSTTFAAAPGATGGIDHITRNVLWISAIVPTAIFIWSHLAFAKQLKGGASSLND